MFWLKRIIPVLPIVLVLSSFTAADTVRRYALAIGVNQGAHAPIPLRYAVTDAERLADVLQEMGGVRTGDCRVLREPDLARVRTALAELAVSVRQGRVENARTEVVVYYSGHADEEGLLIGSSRLPYLELRENIDRLDADVKVAIIDACSSGAITRLKGGVRHPAFLSDAAADMRGYAFLTSSSETEAAQESDRIRASFFTYYLISGLRGAADASGDGRVTLNEVYQFAFNETLGHTVKSMGGAQHPAYDMKLAGTGDFVMTDVGGYRAGLVLPEGLAGRFYILNSDRQLVAELQKPAGRPIQLGLSPGEYVIYLEADGQLRAASFRLAPDQTFTLERGLLIPAKKEPTILRGPTVYSRHPSILAGRHRFELFFGGTAGGTTAQVGVPGVHLDSSGFVGGFAYSFCPREHIALRVSVSGSLLKDETDIGIWPVVSTTDVSAVALLFGARYYPFSGLAGPIRPYVSVEAGPYFFNWNDRRVGTLDVSSSSRYATTFGLRPGAGVDIFIGRHVAIGLSGGYHLHPDVEIGGYGPVDSRGFEVCGSISLLLGKGDGP
ncbi:MAG: caspase family protein [Acidobacteria bacterium]|nr:caspase family protein [Acidobacteriota bacterium]